MSRERISKIIEKEVIESHLVYNFYSDLVGPVKPLDLTIDDLTVERMISSLPYAVESRDVRASRKHTVSHKLPSAEENAQSRESLAIYWAVKSVPVDLGKVLKQKEQIAARSSDHW